MSSSSETLCSAPFTDNTRTAMRYTVSKELTVKSSVKDGVEHIFFLFGIVKLQQIRNYMKSLVY